jgi:hypothetical protein
LFGSVIVVTGSQVTVELDPRARSKEKATVGQFMGLMNGSVLIVGMITGRRTGRPTGGCRTAVAQGRAA